MGGCELDWWSFGVIAFEMLEGRPAFQDQNQQRLFQQIMTGAFVFDHVHTQAATSLVCSLLRTDCASRLKAAEDVKRHAWFASVDWTLALARGLEPPFKSMESIRTGHAGARRRAPTPEPDELAGSCLHIADFTFPEPDGLREYLAQEGASIATLDTSAPDESDSPKCADDNSNPAVVSSSLCAL